MEIIDMNIGNYSKHASIWDWGGYDRTPEFKFWCCLGQKYGKNILSAMSAIGEVGAFMAECGLDVTALDFTKEMVEEGLRRYGDISNLVFVQADICDFKLDKIFDFAFIGSSDLHHLHSIKSIEAALLSINKHLRAGGGLALELWYPSNNSWRTQKCKFEPLKSQFESTKRVWKEGYTSYDAQTKRVLISQEVFIQNEENLEQFTHEFELQLFSRENFFETLSKCGYSVKAEYGGYSFETWSKDSSKWIIEVVKS